MAKLQLPTPVTVEIVIVEDRLAVCAKANQETIDLNEVELWAFPRKDREQIHPLEGRKAVSPKLLSGCV